MDILQRLVVVLAAASGAGKSQKIKKMLALDSGIGMPVTATTRAKRTGEVDGEHYHFYARERFMEMREAGGFLESEENYGNLYGTPCHAIELIHKRGQDALIDVDVRGAKSIKAAMPEAITVFIYASLEQLERQLRERGTDSEEAIAKRLAAASAELGQCHCFDYAIVNDDYERADRELYEIIRTGRLRTNHPLHPWHRLHNKASSQPR